MYIKDLSLLNFRNIQDTTISFGKKINILYGDNAQGKTNLLEAVYICSTGRSHKTHIEGQLVKFGYDEAHIRTFICGECSNDRIDVHVKKDNRKGMAINGLAVKKMSDFFGTLHVVMFSPEDLRLVKGGPSERRRFMDMQLSQLRPAYFYALQRAVRTLNQRNALLKEIARNPSLLPTLDMWDEQLARVGAVICENRREAVDKLAQLARSAHLSLTGGREELNLRYVSQVADAQNVYEALLERLARARSEDLRRMTTTVGVHRDDIAITIDGREARTFASQGQQRSAVLSLKLAQLEWAGQESGEAPILMLDDVMSELDPNRRRQLIERIDRVQTFVTCTDLSDLAGAKQGAVYRVEKGELKRI